MSRINIFGWALMTLGLMLWAYGYFVGGQPPLVDWSAIAPTWISDYLPNLEAEIGLVVMIVAMVPTYWPKAAENEKGGQGRLSQ
jgi:hypothetical protein